MINYLTSLRTVTLFLWTAIIPTTHAVIMRIVEDEFDSRTAVNSVSTNANVVDFRKEIDAVRAGLMMLKERDFIALFGQSVQMPEQSYAMPIGQHRGYTISGLRYSDPDKNLDHIEFYVIGETGIKVHYSTDGISPAAILFYLKVDDTFPRLTEENLNERLAWDRRKFEGFKVHLNRRRVEVFVWEIDVEKEKELYSGIYALDRTTKLDAWISDGERLGYRLDIRKDSTGRPCNWRWYRKDNTLAREVQIPSKEATLPGDFFWYDSDGGTVTRTETSGHPTLITMWWWCRPGSTKRFRSESSRSTSGRPGWWTWSTDGFHRSERDDNGDGIPDWFSESTDNNEEHPLQVNDSWAIHPNLIPNACQLVDQPNRCVPVRRIESEPEQ